MTVQQSCATSSSTLEVRSFKLGNKIADQITRIEGALNLICSIGFGIIVTPQDSVASIPLVADLDDKHAKITGMIET
jgi:hypothetical protein